MKTIITFTFLLITLSVFSQTTREEVVKRNADGQKLIVNTYTGTGNSEKLIKKTYYQDNNNCAYVSNTMIQESPVSLKPILIEYFGKYKETLHILQDFLSYKTGDVYVYSSYGVIQKEEYYVNGNLSKTWKIEDSDVEHSQYRIKYTLIP